MSCGLENSVFDWHCRLLTAMSLLVQQLRQMEEEGKKVLVVFPDEGASKRFKADLANWGTKAIICGKVRNGDKRAVAIKDGRQYSTLF